MRKYLANVLFPNDLRNIKQGDVGTLEALTQAAKDSDVFVCQEDHGYQLLPFEGASTSVGWLEPLLSGEEASEASEADRVSYAEGIAFAQTQLSVGVQASYRDNKLVTDSFPPGKDQCDAFVAGYRDAMRDPSRVD